MKTISEQSKKIIREMQRNEIMAGISLSVACVSFGIGLLVKKFLNIDI